MKPSREKRSKPFKLYSLAGLTLGGVAFSTVERKQFSDPYIQPEGKKLESDILSEGLKIWRKPGAIQNGAACATCHSPDGIELAAYNFTDQDITRRALPHVSQDEAQVLVQYIHTLRAKYQLTTLKSPMEDRPFQPGGSVLPGVTATERDFEFSKQLATKLPLLFGKPITTFEQAKAAERELLSLEPGKLRIGIPLNRLAEDAFHGKEHGTIAQWFPEEPPSVSNQDLEEWYAAEDSYLANPSQEELHKLLLLHSKLVNTNRLAGFAALSAIKFRANLIFQHRLRTKTDTLVSNLSPEVAIYQNFNPMWEVGEFARQLIGRQPEDIGMDPKSHQKKLAGPTFNEQLRSLRTSWFWAGWLQDQGLFRTNRDDKTRLGLWFNESLLEDGPYTMHNFFANTRRQAVISNDVGSWAETIARKRRIWDYAGLRAFQNLYKGMPADPFHRKLITTFACNCFRMNLLLLTEDIKKSGWVWIKISSKSNSSELLDFIVSQQPETKAQTEKLRKELFSLIDTAKERP
ncbi:MAG: hypothetical protein NTU72_03950 [Fimbriimonadales bacterium]|nr:hypothetical protein [Fimbriimonadales bacterium]